MSAQALDEMTYHSPAETLSSESVLGTSPLKSLEAQPTSPPSSKPEEHSVLGTPSRIPENANTPHKRPRFQFSLPSDDADGRRPHKKAKKIIVTTVHKLCNHLFCS